MQFKYATLQEHGSKIKQLQHKSAGGARGQVKHQVQLEPT